MAILHIKAGPAALSLSRGLRYKVKQPKIMSTGDAQTTAYRGRPQLEGEVTIEDEADALAVLTEPAANASITVVDNTGATRTLTLTGFIAFDLDADIADGSKDGEVVGHRIGWLGNLATSVTGSTAVTIGA